MSSSASTHFSSLRHRRLLKVNRSFSTSSSVKAFSSNHILPSAVTATTSLDDLPVYVIGHPILDTYSFDNTTCLSSSSNFDLHQDSLKGSFTSLEYPHPQLDNLPSYSLPRLIKMNHGQPLSDNYQDPNLAYGIKEIHDGTDFLDLGYADLISKLSIQHQEASELERSPVSSIYRSPSSTNYQSPKRASSETNEHEARTPPESGFGLFPIRYQDEPASPPPSSYNLPQPALGPNTPPRSDSGIALQHYTSVNGSQVEVIADDEKGKRTVTSSPSDLVPLADKPFTRLSHHDIVFRANTLPDKKLNIKQCVEAVADEFPSICEAPHRELNEDGTPLPPTKKQETSPEERQARKDAIAVRFLGKHRVSLIKAVVILESRSSSWKRVGSSTPDAATNASPPRQINRLPDLPNPWALNLHHQDLDAAEIKGKSKQMFELLGCRRTGACPKCSGRGHQHCETCKGEKPDECFWCSGTGCEKIKSNATCRRCQGAGVLRCKSCSGKLTSPCKPCEGSGQGEYGCFVEIKVKRIEMPSVPLSALIPFGNPNAGQVKMAAILTLWDSVMKLTEASSPKSKPLVPVMAGCVWETSYSHIVELEVPLAAKFKKGSQSPLRAESLFRKIPTAKKVFSLPSDPDLKPVEVSRDDLHQIPLIQSDAASPSSMATLSSMVETSHQSLMPPPAPRSEVSPTPMMGRGEFVRKPSPLANVSSSPNLHALHQQQLDQDIPKRLSPPQQQPPIASFHSSLDGHDDGIPLSESLPPSSSSSSSSPFLYSRNLDHIQKPLANYI